jgi:hypothetical protein
MNTEIIPVLAGLVGKTIREVVLKDGTGPLAQLFLVFDDGTHYEFYSDGSISGSGYIEPGGFEKVISLGKPNQVVVYPPAMKSSR